MSEKEKEEYEKAIRIVERDRSNSAKIYFIETTVAPISLLGAVWSAAALYALFIEKNNDVAGLFIFMTLVASLWIS